MIITMRVGENVLEPLKRPITGKGGWQILLQKLQDSIDGDSVTVDTKTIRQMMNYHKGSGGWQDRIDPLLNELETCYMVLEIIMRDYKTS
jgi:uncharacterized protein (DUF4415 family)